MSTEAEWLTRKSRIDTKLVRDGLKSLAASMSRLLRYRLLCCLLVGAFTLLARAALLPWIGIPEPFVDDEFSYLLGADTLASGRLTNPPHPMWIHFETIHVLQQPTYASKYPPGEAIVLAAGQRLMGNPWFGVWLSAGVMCALICWMLQGWLPSRWALLGGFLAASQIGILSPWMNSYMGGAVAASGGSLMLGALPRLIRSFRPRHAVAAAAGLIIMLNTRPYEGVLLTIAVFIGFAVWPGQRKTRFARLLKLQVILPLVLLLGTAAAAMSYYNFRVTGNPLSLPYVVYEAQYSYAPLFIWQKPHSMPVYRHSVIRAFWDWSAGYYFRARAQPARVLASILWEGWGFFFFVSDVLIVPILVCSCLLSLPALRVAALITVVFVIGLLQLSYVMPHYLAPAAGMFFLFAAYGLRYLRLLYFRGRSTGLLLPAVIVGVSSVSFILMAVIQIKWPGKYPPIRTLFHARRTVLQTLTRDRSRHLVIVRYVCRWVYNLANIDDAPIVWARDMGDEANRELLRYFSGRKVWLLIPTEPNPILLPYRDGINN